MPKIASSKPGESMEPTGEHGDSRRTLPSEPARTDYGLSFDQALAVEKIATSGRVLTYWWDRPAAGSQPPWRASGPPGRKSTGPGR